MSIYLEDSDRPDNLNDVHEPNESDGSENDDDDVGNMHFSNRHFERRRRRKGVDPTAQIGANPNELLEDAPEVSFRNWGLETPGVDPADTMFAAIPPPVVVCFAKFFTL